MAEKNLPSGDFIDLRRRAEDRAGSDKDSAREAPSPETTGRLLHELQVHEIELEMQNEDLRRTQHDLEVSRTRYFDLYDLAPVGYFALSEKGLILEANLAAAGLLGIARGALVNRQLSHFILPEDQDIYYRHHRQLSATGAPQICELRMLRAGGVAFWTRLEAIVTRDDESGQPVYRTVISDVTEGHMAKEALELERQSLWRMLQASDHERQIVSCEIHDGLAQYLAAALMQFQVYEALELSSPDNAREIYKTAVELVRQSHSESRRLISEVRPPIIDDTGVEIAIANLVDEERRHLRVKIEFQSDVQFVRLSPILENSVYRIVQESLTNACKHSKSKEVKITLTQQAQEVRLEVRDWGTGFDPESVEKTHFGLEGIRQRVRLLGGRLTIDSKMGSGTVVQAVLPIVEESDPVLR